MAIRSVSTNCRVAILRTALIVCRTLELSVVSSRTLVQSGALSNRTLSSGILSNRTHLSRTLSSRTLSSRTLSDRTLLPSGTLSNKTLVSLGSPLPSAKRSLSTLLSRTPSKEPSKFAATKLTSVRTMSLSNDELKRYGRQLILNEIGKEGQLKLKASSVLIVGCGGLGCPSSMYLAAAGVGKQSFAFHSLLLHSISCISLLSTVCILLRTFSSL